MDRGDGLLTGPLSIQPAPGEGLRSVHWAPMPPSPNPLPQPAREAPLAPTEPLVLRDGPDALVLRDVEAGLVLHQPMHTAALAGHERRVAILPYLRGHLSPAIPLPQPAAVRGARLGGFQAPWIDGVPLAPGLIDERSEDRIAKSLAGFLAELHAYPAERAQALGAPGPRDWHTALDDLRRRSVTALRPQLGITRTARLRRWWRSLLDGDLSGPNPAPTHANLAPEHLLVDADVRELRGVLGWSRLTVTDPALDLAAVSEHYGSDFAWLVAEAYRHAGGPIDAAFLGRVRRNAALLPFLDWDRAAAPDDAPPAAATARLLECLAAGPIFSSV